MAGGQAIEGAKRGTMFVLEPEKLVLITDKKHPLYDPRVDLPVKPTMMQSIKMFGVVDPIEVVVEGDKVVVVNGRQRVKAACAVNREQKAAGLPLIQVKCIVTRGDAARLLGILITTNEHRLDDSPLEKAKKAARLFEYVQNEQDVADTFGVTPAAVKKWFKILTLAPAVLEAISQDKLSADAALPLAGKSIEEQEKNLALLLAAPQTDPKNGIAVRAEGEEGRGRLRSTPRRVTARQTLELVGGGRPKMKSRRMIEARLAEKNLPTDYRHALKWVLGEKG